VGDQAFFGVFRAYAARFQYANASTKDFIAVASQSTRQDLLPFFQSWLYAPAAPPMPPLAAAQ
jgi:aminopeptidase N